MRKEKGKVGNWRARGKVGGWFGTRRRESPPNLGKAIPGVNRLPGALSPPPPPPPRPRALGVLRGHSRGGAAARTGAARRGGTGDWRG